MLVAHLLKRSTHSLVRWPKMINAILGINQAHVTLRSRVELSAPIFLLELEEAGSIDNIKLLKVDDTSDATDRTNKLTIEIVATLGAEDLDNGKVYIKPGDFNYRIFESVDATLDITGKKLLEVGLLSYKGDDIAETQYNPTITDKTFIPS